jgi:hypothetical protein
MRVTGYEDGIFDFPNGASGRIKLVKKKETSPKVAKAVRAEDASLSTNTTAADFLVYRRPRKDLLPRQR